MKLLFSLFAHAATVNDGALNLLGGGVDYLKGSSFPGAIATLAVVARLSATPEEVGIEHDFFVELTHAAGIKIAPDVHIKFVQNPNLEYPNNPTTMLVVTYSHLTFPTVGEYTATFFVNGAATGADTFKVVQG